MLPKYKLARTMRKALTAPEFLLWERIKQRGPGRPVFRRQYAFGAYILDFYCVSAKLAVEVDGFHHGEEDRCVRDEARDMWLESQGICVYRLPAAEIFANADAAADGVVLLALSRLGT